MKADAKQTLAERRFAEDAVLRALAYYDLFEHPLTTQEVCGAIDLPHADPAAIVDGLAMLADEGLIHRIGEHFTLRKLPDAVARRGANEARAAEALPKAIALGHRILRLPFVSAVAISGSLSKGVFSEGDDFDFFIVTAPGRLWLARQCIRWLRLSQPAGLLCANYVVDETALELPVQDRFTAMEVLTMIPVGGGAVLGRFREANRWVHRYWPHHAAITERIGSPETASDHAAVNARARAERWLPSPLAAALNRIVHRATLMRLRRSEEARRSLASGDIVMSPQVYKGHRESWKHRVLRNIQIRLDAWEADAERLADRGLDTGSVLFTHSYFYRFDPKQWAFAKPYPPLGTLYAAAVAREAGFAVSLFDTGLAEDASGFAAALENSNAATVVIYDDGFNYLTKMCLTRMREAALGMIAEARARGARVLVCSSDSTDHPELYLEAGANAVIQGEGEGTLREVLEAIRNGECFATITGLVVRDGEAIKANPKRQVKRQLDDLPHPAWDLVDISSYRTIWQHAHGYFSLNISTTRGCPYKCNWCAKPIYGQRYNSRSPEQVVEELALLSERFGASHFWVTDDIFGLKPGWLPRFAELVAERGLDIGYTIQTRVDLLHRPGEIEALAASGLKTAWIGAESGSQSVLDAMDKGITREQIDAIVPRLQAKGIRTATFLQFGYLGESRADIDQTIDMVTGLVPDEIGVSVSYPLPGTGFYDKVKASLGAKANWQDSADLDMMFAGTFAPRFYRYLHGHVHRRHRAAMARARLGGRRPYAASFGAFREAAALVRSTLSRPIDWAILAWLSRSPRQFGQADG